MISEAAIDARCAAWPGLGRMQARNQIRAEQTLARRHRKARRTDRSMTR